LKRDWYVAGNSSAARTVGINGGVVFWHMELIEPGKLRRLDCDEMSCDEFLATSESAAVHFFSPKYNCTYMKCCGASDNPAATLLVQLEGCNDDIRKAYLDFHKFTGDEADLYTADTFGSLRQLAVGDIAILHWDSRKKPWEARSLNPPIPKALWWETFERLADGNDHWSRESARLLAVASTAREQAEQKATLEQERAARIAEAAPIEAEEEEFAGGEKLRLCEETSWSEKFDRVFSEEEEASEASE
jgi:hypothetical protein